jgi:hypothetical protein
MIVEPRKASFGLTFLFGALVFCLFLTLASWWLRLTPAGETYDEKRVANRVKNLSELSLAESQKLKNYAWVDKDKGLVRIPLERAMILALADLQARQVQPSMVAVENPYPNGLQTVAPAVAAAAATPAVPATPAPSASEQPKEKMP